MTKRVEIEYAKKDFDINKGIDLPGNITYHYIDNYHLYIAPDNAAWMAIDEVGNQIMKLFRDGRTIKQIIQYLSASSNKNQVMKNMRDFLVKVERNGFKKNAAKLTETPLISLQIYLTNRCNLKCKHCYMDAVGVNDPVEELTTSEISSVIEDFSKIYQTQVVFTGGEPLLRPDFFKLAKIAKTKNLRVLLFTNGTLINKGMINDLVENVDEIQFSLDGASRETNDKIRGAGVFEKVLNSINLLKNTDINLLLAFVLMPENIDDFKKNIEKLARSIDNVELKFSFATTEGRASESSRFKNTFYGEKEVQQILKILYQKKLHAMPKFEPNLIVKNCGYGEVIAISSNGNIHPCAILKNSAGNIHKDPLKRVINSIRKEAVDLDVDNLDVCPQCDLKYICFGGCRLNNLKYHKNIFKAYCPPNRKEEIYKKLVSRDLFDEIAIWMMEE